jgi:ABC-type molybdenum transport system ATPase subunit/photorepair protein PhrA
MLTELQQHGGDVENGATDAVEILQAASSTSPVPNSFRYRGLTFSADAPDNAPTVLAWKDLTVSVQTGDSKKLLLNNISGTITGGFWAIMGASGGGKTTLLSTLSLRLDRFNSFV